MRGAKIARNEKNNNEHVDISVIAKVGDKYLVLGKPARRGAFALGGVALLAARFDGAGLHHKR